jgi:ABC-2 type transport system permease protein
MRYAFLVAWREYAENIKTKGFWIGIFIFPLMIWLMFSAERWIEKTRSVRSFVLVDQSQELGGTIETALERLYQREVLEAFGEWVQKNSAEGSKLPTSEQLEQMPARDSSDVVAKWAAGNPELLDEFLRNGGLEAALAQVRPLLRAEAGEFAAPRRSFQRVALPEGVDAAQEPAQLAEALKPYLRHERELVHEAESVELFAAVLVPADILERLVRPSAMPALPGTERQGIQYWSANLADTELQEEIEQAVNE